MPNWKVHLWIGCFFAGAAAITNFFTQWLAIDWSQSALLVIPIVLMYSLLPDVDIKTSKIFIVIYSVLTFTTALTILLAVIFQYYGVLWIGLISIGILCGLAFTSHRGHTHSIVAMILFSLPILYFGWTAFGFALIAYLSHLVADAVVGEAAFGSSPLKIW